MSYENGILNLNFHAKINLGYICSCFLRKPFAYLSFYGPVLVGVLTNVVVFVNVTYVILFKLQKNKDKDTMEHNMVCLLLHSYVFQHYTHFNIIHLRIL